MLTHPVNQMSRGPTLLHPPCLTGSKRSVHCLKDQDHFALPKDADLDIYRQCTIKEWLIIREVLPTSRPSKILCFWVPVTVRARRRSLCVGHELLGTVLEKLLMQNPKQGSTQSFLHEVIFPSRLWQNITSTECFKCDDSKCAMCV